MLLLLFNFQVQNYIHFEMYATADIYAYIDFVYIATLCGVNVL